MTWLLTLLFAASLGADITTSHDAQLRGAYEKTAWLYGRHPSTGRFLAIDIPAVAGAAWILNRTEHSRHRWVKWGGRGTVLGLTAVEAHLAYHNAGICRPSSLCH